LNDLHGNRLLSAESLAISAGKINFTNKEIFLKNISFKEADFNLRTYLGEEHDNLKFITDYFSSNDTVSASSKIQFKNLQFKNCSFSYVNENMTKKDHGVDINDLKLTCISGELSDFKSANDSVIVSVRNFTMKDKSGFMLKEFNSEISMTPNMLALKNLIVETGNSKINSDVELHFNSFDDFDDFSTRVNLDVDLKQSSVSLIDAAMFDDKLFGIDKSFSIAGKIKGKVSALKIRQLVFEYYHDTKLEGNININGLPYLQSAYMDIKIDNFQSSISDLETIPISVKENKKTFLSLPENIRQFGKFTFKGNFTGFYNDFVAYGNLNTTLGFASTDINFKTNPDTRKTSYSGRLSVNNFNAGKVLGNTSIGNVSFNIALKGSGFKMNELVEEANGIISNFDFNGYNYHNISLNGNFAKKFFRGTISIHEPNADVEFDGIVDLNGKLPEYNFVAVINYLNLDNLKLVKAGREQILRTRMNINITGNAFENMEGSILIKDSYYHLDKTLFYVNNIGINSFGFGKGRTFYLRSDFADGEVSGLLDVRHLMSSVNELISHYVPNAYSIKDLTIYNQNAAFRFIMKNSDLLTQLFAPQVHLETGTELSGKFNSAENVFSFRIISPEVSIGNIRLSALNFSIENDASKLHAGFKTQSIAIGSGIKIDAVGLSASAQNNIVDFQFSASDIDSFPNRLSVKGNYKIFSPTNGKVVFEKSSAFINHEEWTLSHENSVDIDSTAIRISGLTLSRDKQFFGLNGVISKKPSDLLDFSFNNFRMENINPLISSSGFEFGGVLDGKFSVSGIYSKLNLQSALTIRNFCLNTDTIGFASVNSIWNDEKQELSAQINVTKGTKKIIDVEGKYFPSAATNNFDFRISLNDIYLHPFEKFIDDVFSQLYGKLSGELTLKGSSSEPLLNGKIKITKGNFILNFLNTHYSFTDEISVSPYSFGFHNLMLNDENGDTAILNGKLSHHNFNDLTLNLRMDADHFQCMNTNYTGTEIYYGTANASGFATLDGPVKSLFIDLNLSSDKGTKIFFPLQSTSENSENSFVTFVNKSVHDTLIQSGKSNMTGVTLTSNLELTTDAEIQIIFDEKIGDVIKGKGNGNLKLSLTPDGEFSINGNVIIEDGDYLFTLKNVINKKFRIEPGSIVTFSGDPLDADVNLTAIYRTRAYLRDLIPNDSSYLSRQTVDCLLKLSGKLFNPKVKFEVLIPGGDATTQSLVNNVLNNEEEMSKQVISLLVLNSFQPINRGAGAAGNYTGSAGANASELLSNQVSNWLSQLSKDVNISFNYRARDAVSREELDLALSSQQFNDRVTIDVNVGVTGDRSSSQQNNSQTQNTIIGDFNAEYKVSQDGRIRLKAFNRTNNNTLLTNNSPYTQGVGIFYRVDFDHFSDLWKKKKTKKKETNLNQ